MEKQKQKRIKGFHETWLGRAYFLLRVASMIAVHPHVIEEAGPVTMTMLWLFFAYLEVHTVSLYRLTYLADLMSSNLTKLLRHLRIL